MWLVVYVIIIMVTLNQFKSPTVPAFLFSCFVAVVLLAIPYSLVEYFKVIEAKTAFYWGLSAAIILGLCTIIYKKIKFIKKRRFDAHTQALQDELDKENKLTKSEKSKRTLALIAKIIHFTERDFISDFSQILDLGTVHTSEEKTREDVEQSLKIQAAELGANAILKFSWTSRKRAIQAGRRTNGYNDNQNTAVFDGEALAVILEASGQSPSITYKPPTKPKATRENYTPRVVVADNASPAPESNPEFKKYSGKKIILDGNSIVENTGQIFQPLTLFLEELKAASYEYTLFFNDSINMILIQNNLMLEDESITECISRISCTDEVNIIVMSAETEADAFILELAERQKAAIISNNIYTEFKATYGNLFDDNLLRFELVGDVILVPKLILILPDKAI